MSKENNLNFFSLGILPFIALSYMNYYIFRQIHQSRKVISQLMRFIIFLICSKILRGRQNEKRQSELNLAMTLFSIVLMHILCNILRVILGVLVVTLVGIHYYQYISLVVFKTNSLFRSPILIFLRFLDSK